MFAIMQKKSICPISRTIEGQNFYLKYVCD